MMSDRHETMPISAGVLRPSESLWDRVAHRISVETGVRPLPAPTQQWSEPDWEEVAPGISCKWLSVDVENERVSLLVRFAPAAHYPAYRQEAIEEFYLLHGELWVDGRKLCPGEFRRAKSGHARAHVWSETGCTCVVIALFSHVALRGANLRGRRAQPGRTHPMLRTIRRSRAQEE